MTERERWIVYPLLFLALGAALRDKLAKQTRAKQIVCEQLYVVDPQGRPIGALSGEGLRFDPPYGYVLANVIDADVMRQGGRPVAAAGQGPSWPQLLQLLQQLGVRFGVTPAPQPRQPQPAPGPPGADSEDNEASVMIPLSGSS